MDTLNFEICRWHWQRQNQNVLKGKIMCTQEIVEEPFSWLEQVFGDGLLCAVFHCITVIFDFSFYCICICNILQMYLYLHDNSIVFVFERRPGQAERTIPGCEQDLHKTAINSSKLPSLHLIYIVGWWEQWWCCDDNGDGVAYFTSLALFWYVWVYR